MTFDIHGPQRMNHEDSGITAVTVVLLLGPEVTMFGRESGAGKHMHVNVSILIHGHNHKVD